MIRMKAKNLLLSIALIMACFCFFACKDTKVKVESISFTEQSISMLVGEEYTPSIKILPSYATDRSYALISGDVTALKVDGGTITALKAVKGVKLKVVSNENQNINDIVTVDIYAEATDLETPTNLKFDGNKFSFTSEDNSSASSYMLKIGEQEIDIGNNTEYSFANITNKSSNVYDTVLTCSVKAIGDGKIFKNSNYSEPISFVKFSSVSNAYVENETLYFDAIKNVSRYDVDILVNSNVVQSKIVNNSTYSEGQLNLSIADLTDSVNGAEYVLRITPSAEGYNGDIDAENIFTSEAVEINYTVVGTVKNVTINDKVISWDFVDNAQNYTVKLYKGSLLLNEYKNITYNYIYVEYEDACEYYCEILANSNQPNTTSGKIYSNRLGFSILDYPQVNIINNTVSWNSVENAEGYLITIKNSLGATLVNKQFVLSNTYDISNFEAGTYNIEVVACGNGHEILSSKASTQATWTILSGLQLKVENKKLYWTDLDENSLNKYHLTFNTNSSETVDVVLKDDNIGSQYSYNEELNQYIYDLSSYNFEPNTYTISVTSLGENNVFDADTNMISITKLAEGSISSLANKQFTINSVESAVGYKIEIYKSTDANLTTPIVTLDSIKSGNKFDLDSSVLDVGKYIAKVLVYGNNKNIFDADNQNLGTTLSFEKLSTPQITVNKDNSKLIIGQIDGAVTYKLFENNADKNITTQEYDLTSLVAGDYIYRAQALGDNATILDSDQTLGENEIKVKKLATPNIDFDKDTMTYTMSCQDEGYVGAYNFTLNNSTVEVKSNQADCASLMASAGEYVAKVHATPVSANAEYHLLIQSASAEYAVSKLAGKCGFEIVDGKLLVTPTSALTETGYGLEVRIENGNSDIILSDFVYQNSRFELDLHDQNYDIVEENIATLLTNPNQYDMFATIYNQDKDVVSSNETQIINKLTVLGRVDDIKRNTQTIEFNVVSNATNYILVINFDGKDTYIDLAGINIAGNGKNVLQIADVIKLMEQNGVQYVAEMSYKIKFVAVSNSAYTLANKGIVDYTFEFLKVPTISIIEMDDNNFKWLVIENDNDKVYMYNIVMQQGEVDQSSYCMRSGSAKTYICLDAMTKIEAGQASILVKSNANEGDYFDSKNAEINVVKLNSSTISINDGLLQWNAVDNAKQYNLTYTIDGAEQTVALKNGSENFAIENGKCIYNFDLLQSGLTDLYLQVDSELVVNNAYYLNSNKGEVLTNIYKLPTVDIQVKKGQIYTEIYKSDFSLVKKIEVYVDNQLLDLDITVENEYITKQDSTDRFSITINPVALLKYGTSALLMENIALKLYSNNTTTLNSSLASKGVYGLLSPASLDITTSTTSVDNVISEVFEKITWTNPRANSSYVASYEIVINYDGKDYIFITSETAFMMPTYYDANSNNALDEDEIEFGAGVYTIKARAITDNNESIVNSKYCEAISVTVLETPKDLATQQGNIIWANDINVEYYLIKVYLIDDNSRTLLISSQSKVSEFDLCNLKPLETGVYGVTVQAMHNNSRVLASDESEMLQVIRLPQVTSYFVKNGELYINAHSFYSKAEIYLTDKQTGERTYTFTVANDDLSKYITYIESMEDWASSSVLSTYEDESYYVQAKYIEGDDATFRSALAEDYRVEVKLIGNTATNGAIISGHSSEATNLNLADDTIEDKNLIHKLVTPTIKVSDTERGVLLMSIPSGVNYSSLSYYVNDANSLKGVHLYQVNVMTSEQHTMYVAEIVDETLFNNSLTAVNSQLVQDDESKNLLKHFEYDGKTFNVIDKTQDGYIAFNFNTNYYYYYSVSGAYTLMDLSAGGSFVASVRFMGDDTKFVQSNLSDNATIKRYKVLNLSINNGVLSWLNQATSTDHPIYLVTLTNETETYNLVLYNPNVYTKEQVMACLETGKDYIFDTITYVVDESVTDEYITYSNLANIVDEARKDASQSTGVGGVFHISVKAHYTNTSANDIILAQGAETKTGAILPQAQINVNNGVLTWDLSYVTNSGGQEYIYNYLLQVCDAENNKLYEINLSSGDYNVSNYVATYELPKTLKDGEFEFVANTTYVFNLVALAGNSTTYLNSVTTSTNTITLLPDLQDVRMENGVLVWNNTTTNSVEIHISYTLGDATIVYITQETKNSFELPASFTDIGGTSRQFVAGYDYSIKIRLSGTNNSLNGFYSEPIVTQRLDTVPTNSIATNNGVLTWSANKTEGVKYTVKYTLADLTTGETELLDSNQFDFTGLPNGAISAQIIAHHNNYFSSFISESVELFKLDAPSNIKFNEGTTTITWDIVFDNNGAEITNYMVSIRQEGAEDTEYKCITNEWIITGVTSNAFSIAVKAISVDEKGILINSEYTAYQSMEQPYQVDVTTFEFDETLQAFKWKAIEGESDSDKYYIGYNYLEPNGNTPTSIEPIQATVTNIINNEKYYSYYPSVIGKYSLIYVQVVRAGSLSSQPTYCQGAEGNYVLDFNLFTSGNGVDKPYIISNETHLRNIKYFLNANYELDANITLTSKEPITDSTQVFTGSINGNSKYIYGVTNGTNSTFSTTGYVGLFNKVAGATFNNIQLSGFELNGYLGSSTLYMGILVGYASGLEVDQTIKQTTFNNIVITSSTITLTKDNQNGYVSDSVEMYVGVVAGYAQNSIFNNCTINLGGSNPNINIYVKGDASTKISICGIVGYANACELTNNTSGDNQAFIIQYTLIAVYSYAPTLNLGALIGEIGTDEGTISGNSCEYSVYNSQGLTTNFNEIGNKI